MNAVRFNVEETNVIAIYHGKTREQTIITMVNILEHIKDESMRKIIIRCIEKLADMTDKEFDNYNFIMTE